MEAGFTPDTFWRQTERSYVLAIEGAADRSKREIEREQMVAYTSAALNGLAFVGKLKPYEEHFPNPANSAEASTMPPEGAKMLSAIFKLKQRGVPMKIERVNLH